MTSQRKGTIVIIGGGLGGLALAARLAHKGYAVTLCEKNERLGGKMNLLERDGFRFDTGPSLVTLLNVFQRTFRALGYSLNEFVTPLRINPLAHYRFSDGTILDYTTALPDLLKNIGEFDPRDVEGFLKLMNVGANIYQLSRETFFTHSPFEFPPTINPRVLKHLPIRYGWGNYARTVMAHVRSPHLRQFFNRYPTYVGSSPYLTSATLIVIPYIEFAYGGWYFKGGLYRLIEALEQIAREKGVAILKNSEVIEISHLKKKIRGVRLADGIELQADVVVMNGDASMVGRLLRDEKDSALDTSERSLSGIVFLIGLSRTMPELHHHAVLFSDSYEEEFSQLFNAQQFPDDPTVYVNVASRTDRSLVPGEGETLFIMANAPAAEKRVWDSRSIEHAWHAIIRRLKNSGFPEFQNAMLFREVLTPTYFAERFLMPGGAIYGHNSHGWKNTFLRPPNKDLSYDGLYYVGGSSHPGGGTPMVLLSAEITERWIDRNA